MGSAPFCLGIIKYPINLPKTNRGRLVFNISPTGGPQQQGGRRLLNTGLSQTGSLKPEPIFQSSE